jgi:hypothetical protein
MSTKSAPRPSTLCNSRLALRIAFLTLGFIAAGSNVSADPPPDPPPCDVKIVDGVFCGRITQIVSAENPNSYLVEGEFINWTPDPVHGVILILNRSSMDSSPPIFGNALIDGDGRPITGVASPPSGNTVTTNDWTGATVASPRRIDFSKGTGTPIPAPRSLGFRGLRDPDFRNASQMTCVNALLEMIPGSSVSGNCITIANKETIDDGPNMKDGFVIRIDNYMPGDEVSITWFFLDVNGQPLGFADMAGNIQGRQYGFGAFNLARLNRFGRGFPNNAPPALWDISTGGTNSNRHNFAYDPPTDINANADSPLHWAEDEVGGFDTFPVNPIPAGLPGQGEFFVIEQGAAITPPFRTSGDNLFNTGTNVRSSRVDGSAVLSSLGAWGSLALLGALLTLGLIGAIRRFGS